MRSPQYDVMTLVATSLNVKYLSRGRDRSDKPIRVELEERKEHMQLVMCNSPEVCLN